MPTRDPRALAALRWLGHQDWLRYGLRERVLRRFCNPDSAPPLEFEVDFFGARYVGRLDSFLDWCVYFYGAFEKQELYLLRDLLTGQPGAVFVDVGANVGQHTLFMAAHCATVHAFEPLESVRRRLEQKIQSNGCRNVVVHDVALGAADEKRMFFAPQGANTGTGSFLRSRAVDNNAPAGALRIVEGDRYLAGVGVGRVDLLKIDVEGFEIEVLKGLAGTLRRSRPHVLVEVSEETWSTLGRPERLLSFFPEGYLARKVVSNRPCCGVFNHARYELVSVDAGGGEALICCSPAIRVRD